MIHQPTGLPPKKQRYFAMFKNINYFTTFTFPLLSGREIVYNLFALYRIMLCAKFESRAPFLENIPHIIPFLLHALTWKL